MNINFFDAEGCLDSMNYFIRVMFLGEHGTVMVLFAIGVAVSAWRNCYGARSTGQALYRHSVEFYIATAIFAGCFHFVDLFHEWYVGDIELIVDGPDAASALFALFCGAVAGSIIFVIYHMIEKKKTKMVEWYAFNAHIKKLSRKN